MTLRGFLRWWRRELAALLPERVRQAARSRRALLQLELTEDAIHVRHRIDGGARELGSVARGTDDGGAGDEEDDGGERPLARRIGRLRAEATQVLVTLPPGLALRRTLELPLATEENLAQALSFQLERETPFLRDDVYFDYRVLGRDPGAGRLQVRLDVASRRTVDAALALVADWEVVPAPGRCQSPDEGAPALGFLPRGYREAGAGRLKLALAAVNALLLGAVVLVPFVEQQRAIEALRGQVAEARERAGRASALRERIDALRSQTEFLAERRRARPPVVRLLEELSGLLPDSTWIVQLQIQNGEVHFQGVSDSASSLISPLESSPLLRDVSFSSPVMQDDNTGRERFRLSARVAGAASGEEEESGA